MKIEYDKDADALYIIFKEGTYSISKEIEDGIIIDYNKKGDILGIEIIEASNRMKGKELDEITVSLTKVMT